MPDAVKPKSVAPGIFGLPYMHSLDFYLKCCVGGVLACGVTHSAVVTLDVAKCRAQAHSKAGRWPKSLVAGLRKIASEEGSKGAVKGITPTFFGYGAQGFFKFGFNELFKDYYGKVMGDEWVSGPAWKKMVLWGAASGSAELFADVALCPFEMTKVKMQVSLPGTSPQVPDKFGDAWRYMKANKADTRFPFGSLAPLWGRQVPYTIIKFVGFYQTQDMVYKYLATNMNRPKSSFNEGQQLAITFGCGYWAGIFCAVATQPMDNLVSMKGIAENKNKPWGQMAKEMGTFNLFTKGLGTRIIMIGTLTGLQWWIYGSFKSVMGFGTS